MGSRDTPTTLERFSSGSASMSHAAQSSEAGNISLLLPRYLSCSSLPGSLECLSLRPLVRGWQYLTVASPIFVMLLITRLSGVPLLEASGLKRWGGSAEYQRYIRDVPVLIPFIKT